MANRSLLRLPLSLPLSLSLFRRLLRVGSRVNANRAGDKFSIGDTRARSLSRFVLDTVREYRSVFQLNLNHTGETVFAVRRLAVCFHTIINIKVVPVFKVIFFMRNG